jgi:MFS family permease
MRQGRAWACCGPVRHLATLGLWLVERFDDPIQLASFAVGAASRNGGLLSVRFAAAVGWAPAAGHLSDRVGRLPFLAVSGVEVVVGLLGLSMGLSLPGTVAIVVLLFLSGPALRVSLDAAAGDQAPPERRSQRMSWYATASDLGASAGPFLAYSLAGWVGLAGVYRGAAVCVLLTGLCTLPLLRPEKRRRREAEVD